MKKRGVTIISLSIIIIVMLIILSIVSVSLNYSISNAKKMAFAKEIYNIQSMVDEYVQREETLPNTYEAITVTPTVEIAETQFEGETFTNGTVNLYVLDLKELDIKNTSYGNKKIGSTDVQKEKDIYAVSEKTGKVYYIAGFESDGKKYYTLTDELRQMIEKNQNVTIGEKTITFTPSKLGWSSEGVSVDVFVPTEFTSPSITIDNANITYTSTSDSNGVYYIVNNEKVVEGYTITVNYSKNGTTGTATYTAKVDTVTPVISKNAGILNTETRINGLESNDNKSGIKYFKYAEGVIDENDVKEYIHAYGKNVNKGSLKFDTKTKYTLYAEDKAGNYIIMYINKLGELVETIPLPPTLAASYTWYKGSTPKNTITTINIVDVADNTTIATATESWPAAVDKNGDNTFDNDIMCYVNGITLTIAGNGSGEIMANENSSYAFSYFYYYADDIYFFSKLTEINGFDIFDTRNVKNMDSMFCKCPNLKELDVSNFVTDKVENMRYMFRDCKVLSEIDVSGFDTGNVKDMSGMFSVCSAVKELDVSNFNTSNVTDMNNMFCACDALTTVDVSNFSTKNVTNMAFMFFSCDALTTVDVSGFNTGNVKSMSNMFAWGHALKVLDVSNFDTRNVTDMSYMFYCCDALTTLDVSNFDTSNVENLNSMFGGCYYLTEIDVSNFNTSNVTIMSYMFSGTGSLTTLNVSSFDTTKVAENGLDKFAWGCGSNKIILGENFGQSSNISLSGNDTGMFYLSHITDTTVYGANDVMKAYDWAGDNRNVTFETVSP